MFNPCVPDDVHMCVKVLILLHVFHIFTKVRCCSFSTHRPVNSSGHSTFNIQHFRTVGQRKQSTTEAKGAGQPPNEDGAHHFPHRPSRCSLHWASLHPLPVPCNPSSPACLGTVPPVSLLGHTPCTKQSLLGSTFGRSTPQDWVLLYICTYPTTHHNTHMKSQTSNGASKDTTKDTTTHTSHRYVNGASKT